MKKKVGIVNKEVLQEKYDDLEKNYETIEKLRAAEVQKHQAEITDLKLKFADAILAIVGK